MNTPQTLIFVGRSGAGKGTQIELLKKYVSEKSEVPIKSLVMGEIYRAFFKEPGYIQDIARDLSMVQGKFQPDFMTNALFVSNAVHLIDESSHIFIDGYPRTVDQFKLLLELLEYARRTNAIVVNVEVSRNSVRTRLLARGRGDDSENAVESRLNEYERTVVPMLNEIKQTSGVTYIEVDGEPSPETIHKDLVAKLGL